MMTELIKTYQVDLFMNCSWWHLTSCLIPKLKSDEVIHYHLYFKHEE